MRLALRTLTVGLATGALASAWGGFARQDVALDGAAPSGDVQAEMLHLFADIERNLESIDVTLSDAAAGDTSSLAELEAAGLGDLLRDSVRTGRQVQDDLQRIIELAQRSSDCLQCAAGT